MTDQPVPPELAEHLGLLQRYLSDEVAPLVFVEALDALMELPPALAAGEVHTWLAAQYRGGDPLPVSDYLFHAMRKLHVVGELGLVPADRLREYLRLLGALLLEQCPEQDRDVLAGDFATLDDSKTVMAAPIQIVHRSGGGEAPRRATGRAEAPQRGDVAVSAPAPTGGAPLPERVVQGLRRLDLLLDRLERAPAGAEDQDAPPAPPDVLLSRILAAAAVNASDASDLDGTLEKLRKHGVNTGTRHVLQLLGQALPEWRPPSGEDRPEPASNEAARALRQVVALGRDRSDVARRFSELVQAACDEFNTGSLGRTVTMLDLAERMAVEERVDSVAVRMARAGGWNALDADRLRTLAESPETHQLLRSVLEFFTDLSVEHLLDELSDEQKRERRRLLILLLVVHGARARATALERLQASASGATWADWYVERNLLHLLRRIPAPVDAPLDAELDVLVRLSQPGAPVAVIREAIAVLALHRHSRAEQTLIARVSELEDGLLAVKTLPYEPGELIALLDGAVRTLTRCGSPAAWRCVVDHGLKRRPQLGDTTARLTDLASQDLAGEPELVARLVKALRDELPTKVFGMTVQTKRRSATASNLLLAISGTQSAQVREVLQEIAERHGDQALGAEARRVLASLVIAEPEEEQPAASLSGDLRLFGLPTLLQNLAESQVTGTLSLLGAGPEPAATLRFVDGDLVEATAGRLQGNAAVFTVLERRQVERFVFLDSAETEQAVQGSPVLPLLMEGVRRLDEYERAAAVVADDVRLVQTEVKPSRLADEADVELMRTVWRRALAGATPRTVEDEVAVDPYRVRRLFEHWVAEGSLRPS